MEGRLLYGDELVHVRHYAMETWMNVGLGVAAHILKLRTRHGHVRSLTIRPLHPCILFIGGWVTPRARAASIAGHKIFFLAAICVCAHDVKSQALSLCCMSYPLFFEASYSADITQATVTFRIE